MHKLALDLLEARKDAERLDWIEKHKGKANCWKVEVAYQKDTIWLSSGTWTSDTKRCKVTLRDAIDAARQKEETK